MTRPIPLRVASTVYDAAIEQLRYWADQALMRGEIRYAAQLTVERHSMEEERDRVRRLERLEGKKT